MLSDGRTAHLGLMKRTNSENRREGSILLVLSLPTSSDKLLVVLCLDTSPGQLLIKGDVTPVAPRKCEELHNGLHHVVGHVLADPCAPEFAEEKGRRESEFHLG